MNGVHEVRLNYEVDLVSALRVVQLRVHAVSAGYARYEDMMATWVDADEDPAHLRGFGETNRILMFSPILRGGCF